jgi:hypothetical protein
MTDDVPGIPVVGRVLAQIIDEVFHCFCSLLALIMPLFWGWASSGSAQPEANIEQEKGDSRDEWNPMALMVDQRSVVQRIACQIAG